MEAAPLEQAECPRCGYDLSGSVRAWKDACDLQGVCSECGLAFRWGDVLSPPRLGPHWSFEHGWSVSALRWVRTAVRSLWPPALWRSLRLWHQVRLRRLAVFALILLLALHAAMVLAVIVDHLLWQTPWTTRAQIVNLGVLLWPYGEDFVYKGAYSGGGMSPLLVIEFGPALCMPLAMLVLGETMRRAKVRPRHLVRGLVYFLPSAVVCYWIGVSAVIIITITPGLRSLPSPGIGVQVLIATLLYFGPLWTGVWWYFFIARYLRLRHALGVTIVMMIVAILLVAVATGIVTTRLFGAL